MVQALLLALLLLTALLGAGEETRSGELGGLMRYESGSGFVRHTEYRRLGEEDWLYLDDYDCRYAWLAEAICADPGGGRSRMSASWISTSMPL